MNALQMKLELQQVVSYFSLPSNKNGRASTWDFKQKKNLVLFFNHGVACPHCTSRLQEFAASYPRFQELEAEIIAISLDTVEKLNVFASRGKIVFPCLSDENKEATEKYTHMDAGGKAPFPSVFITDRFGVLRYQQIAGEANELLSSDEILSWLLLIQTECPECSHP